MTTEDSIGEGEYAINLSYPGFDLGEAKKDVISGPGTYIFNGRIRSALAGVINEYEDEKTKAKTISVVSPKAPSIVPKTGNKITARVTSVNARLVQCQILCVEDFVMSRPYRGILRKEDIRLLDKDKIDPYKCYRPGDIILAKILPMREMHCYYLTTAENELGVVICTAEGSPQGIHMVPISWSEMQCPKTLVKESRKVARVIPETINRSFVLATPGEDEKTGLENTKTD
ncbi:unnamed protein product [Leptosia nina]|uniref:Exosome complex component CSL4 C-terminal domain-containing protein n=1 Tax=Leptosia nina TaxID=320188 RepID=A0AAV1IYF3_9NEOP